MIRKPQKWLKAISVRILWCITKSHSLVFYYLESEGRGFMKIVRPWKQGGHACCFALILLFLKLFTTSYESDLLTPHVINPFIPKRHILHTSVTEKFSILITASAKSEQSPGRHESCALLDPADESLPSREKILVTRLNCHTHCVFNLINNYVRTYKICWLFWKRMKTTLSENSFTGYIASIIFLQFSRFLGAIL